MWLVSSCKERQRKSDEASKGAIPEGNNTRQLAVCRENKWLTVTHLREEQRGRGPEQPTNMGWKNWELDVVVREREVQTNCGSLDKKAKNQPVGHSRVNKLGGQQDTEG